MLLSYLYVFLIPDKEKLSENQYKVTKISGNFIGDMFDVIKEYRDILVISRRLEERKEIN